VRGDGVTRKIVGEMWKNIPICSKFFEKTRNQFFKNVQTTKMPL
jgi:hypothetical protein